MVSERDWKPSTDGDRLREKLFDQGSRALAALGLDQEFYICPLCGIGFSVEAIVQKILTLEHVPPKSAGGRELVLTCHKCNNGSGSGIDAALAKSQRYYRSVKSILGDKVATFDPIAVELSTEKRRVQATISRDLSGYVMNVSDRFNQSSQIQGFHSELGSFRAGDGFRLSFGGKFRSQDVQRGLVKSAFLFVFAKMGYSFALSSAGRFIRDYIQGGSESVGRFHLKTTDDVPDGLFFVKKHPVVIVSFSDHRIVLPSHDFSGTSDEFFAIADRMRTITVDLVPLPRSIEALLDHSGRYRLQFAADC